MATWRAAGSIWTRTTSAPGYFAITGIPVSAGREFDDRDQRRWRARRDRESVARDTLLPWTRSGRPTVGDREFTAEIVGVSERCPATHVEDAPVPMVYFPSRPVADPANNLAVRVSGDVGAGGRTVRTALQQASRARARHGRNDGAPDERNVSVSGSSTYLASAFGALALLLGCVGLYGVLLPARGNAGVRCAGSRSGPALAI